MLKQQPFRESRPFSNNSLINLVQVDSGPKTNHGQQLPFEFKGTIEIITKDKRVFDNLKYKLTEKSNK